MLALYEGLPDGLAGVRGNPMSGFVRRWDAQMSERIAVVMRGRNDVGSCVLQWGRECYYALHICSILASWSASPLILFAESKWACTVVLSQVVLARCFGH